MGWNFTRTSVTSFRAFLRVHIILSSSIDVSATVAVAQIFAVKSTNINDPARRARKLLIERIEAVSMEVEDFDSRGLNKFSSDRRVREGTPASVKSPHAPNNSWIPCWRITTDTTSPT